MNILTIIENKDYVSTIIKILKEVYEESKNKILYITLSRPYKSLIIDLANEKVEKNRFIVIDAITKRVIPNPQIYSNCQYVKSPTSFYEISLTIESYFRKFKFDNVIFDSLSSLAIYSTKDDAIKFIHELVSKVSVLGDCEGVFMCAKSDMDSEFIKKITMDFDKTIDLSKR